MLLSIQEFVQLQSFDTDQESGNSDSDNAGTRADEHAKRQRTELRACRGLRRQQGPEGGNNTGRTARRTHGATETAHDKLAKTGVRNRERSRSRSLARPVERATRPIGGTGGAELGAEEEGPPPARNSCRPPAPHAHTVATLCLWVQRRAGQRYVVEFQVIVDGDGLPIPHGGRPDGGEREEDLVALLYPASPPT